MPMQRLLVIWSLWQPGWPSRKGLLEMVTDWC